MATQGYRVKLTEQAARKIEDFQPRIVEDVGLELEHLGKDPLRLSKQIHGGPLHGRMSYQFRISRPPRTWRFTVIFQYGQDEESIEVTDFGFLLGEDSDYPELSDPEP